MKFTDAKLRGLLQTTFGDLITSVFDSAYEEFADVFVARRIAARMLLRKLRRQEKHPESVAYWAKHV